jgi:hypothetical protein
MPELTRRCAQCVTRFEGMADKFTGDRVMALFGASVALEDHARRACYAGLEMQRSNAVYDQELRHAEGIELALPVGTNSGEVIVGDIAIADRFTYTAIGHAEGYTDDAEQVLLRKPGALPGAIALVQARKSGVFTAEHEAFWVAARKALGDSAGTRALVEVLLLHRRLAEADVLAGIIAALSVGSVNADVVAVQARKAAQQRGVAPPPLAVTPRRHQVVSLTERRLGELPGDDRPLPSVDVYDDLLGKASS